MPENAFEALCQRGARENWQLDPSCGPCCSVGHRFGFAAIARGIDVTTGRWPTTQGVVSDPVLGDVRTPFSIGVQGVLSGIVASANIKRLSDSTPIAVWLGTLNLLLQMTADVERETGLLTAKLVPQLSELCPIDHRENFGRTYSVPDRRLQPQDLTWLQRLIAR